MMFSLVGGSYGYKVFVGGAALSRVGAHAVVYGVEGISMTMT